MSEVMEMREFESHLRQKIFRSIIFSNAHCIVKVTNTEFEISIDRWAIEMFSDILRILRVF